MSANTYPMPGMIKPRKVMAGTTERGTDAGSGGGSPSFGISPIPGGVPSVNHMDQAMPHPHPAMADGDRAYPIARDGKKLHAQRHPDHGPHHLSTGMHPAGSMSGRGRGSMKPAFSTDRY